MENSSKLERINKESKVAGVCTGLGEYFEKDPVIFRLIFIVSSLFAGVGTLPYFIMWLLFPVADPENKKGSFRILFLIVTIAPILLGILLFGTAVFGIIARIIWEIF